jgi:NDP-sugar pyrophosphorylase family protein
MILHQVESLAAAGVTDIVLAVNYRPDIMVAALKKVCHDSNPFSRVELLETLSSQFRLLL